MLAILSLVYCSKQLSAFFTSRLNSKNTVWYLEQALCDELELCVSNKQKSVLLHKRLSYYPLLSALVISPLSLANANHHKTNPQRNGLPEAMTEQRRKWQKGWDRATKLMSLQKKNKRKSQDESSMWNHVIQYNLRNIELTHFQLLNWYCQCFWQKQKK